MLKHKINESFDTLRDAIEFYYLFQKELARFKTIQISIDLIWGKPFVVKGEVAYRDSAQEEILEDVLQNLDK